MKFEIPSLENSKMVPHTFDETVELESSLLCARGPGNAKFVGAHGYSMGHIIFGTRELWKKDGECLPAGAMYQMQIINSAQVCREAA